MLAIVLVAACGGGGKRLTREDYAKKADAVCSKYNQQTKDLSAVSSLSELAAAADKLMPILDHALTDLRKLKPPTEEQMTADQWLASIDKLRADLREIRDRAKSNDMQAVQSFGPKALRDNARTNQLARQLGMSVCNKA